MEGKCGNCKSEDIKYGDSDLDGNALYYDFTCNKCGKSGKEWYNLEYSETIMDEEVCQRCYGLMRCRPLDKDDAVDEDGLIPCPNCEGEGK